MRSYVGVLPRRQVRPEVLVTVLAEVVDGNVGSGTTPQLSCTLGHHLQLTPLTLPATLVRLEAAFRACQAELAR